LKNNRQNRQNGQNRQILQCFVGAGVEPPPHPEDIDDSREEVSQGPRDPDTITGFELTPVPPLLTSRRSRRRRGRGGLRG
jgi:hypothetical protein